MREVIINGTNYNQYVESVVFSSGVDEGSAASIYCIDGMPEIQAFSPITVKIDGLVVFKGFVGAPDETWGENPARLVGAKYECYNNGALFKNMFISGDFSGPANEVIERIVDTVKADPNKYGSFPYTVKIQSTINFNINVTLSFTELNAAFDTIAQQISGYWFVTHNDEIYFFQTSMADVDRSTITVQYSNVQTPYNHKKATDQVVNRITVIGGEGDSNEEQTWTYNGSVNTFFMPSYPRGLSVTWNGEPVYLMAEGYSGDPYIAADKDFKATIDSSSDGSFSPGGINYVVVHHTASQTATKADLYQWHVVERGWSDIGYHWFVRKDGTVEACRPESVMGAHVKGHNSYTIGVGCEGDYERADTEMPEAQFRALTSLVIDIMSRYKMDRTHLAFHGDLVSTECPGKYFPTDALRKAVRTGDASNYAVTPPTNVPVANSNKRMYFNASEQYIKVIPGYEPPNGTVIHAKYYTLYNVSAERYNYESYLQYGRWIHKIIADASITSVSDAVKQADALLAQYALVKETVALKLVNYQQIYAGDKVYLPWLDRYGLVTATSGELRYNDFEDNAIGIEVSLI